MDCAVARRSKGTNRGLYPLIAALLQLLEEKIEAVDEDIRDLAREAVRVTAELEAIRDKLTNLKEYY